MIATAIEAVGRELDRYGRVAVAVSGGIDSLTLSALAHARLGSRAQMFHSLTASVPQEATARTRRLALERGWDLHVVDAGEFAREDYLANPANRCFYCKQSLYAELARRTAAQLVSGANTGDLADYRPGLDAAREAGARHPFIDAGVDKATIRAIAREVGLGGLAELPSSPCLSSRVETGIRIAAPMLARIDEAETAIRARVRARDVRCRVRATGVVIELDREALAALTSPAREAIAAEVARLFGSRPAFEAYRTGSAFLRESS